MAARPQVTRSTLGPHWADRLRQAGRSQAAYGPKNELCTRLLAEFEGQDTSYAVAVNPRTGGQRPLRQTGEHGFVGTALSKDGTTVLGFLGGFEPGPDHLVATVPYSGAIAKMLVKNAFEPDWSR